MGFSHILLDSQGLILGFFSDSSGILPDSSGILPDSSGILPDSPIDNRQMMDDN